MQRRNTIQKDFVLKAVQEMGGHVTAEDVYACVQEKHPAIGKGTVYRNLGILAEEGQIRKIEIPNGPDRFDLTLHKHYHVKCVNCGKVFDAEMDEAPNLMDHIRDTRGMEYLGYDILFKGICPDCKHS